MQGGERIGQGTAGRRGHERNGGNWDRATYAQLLLVSYCPGHLAYLALTACAACTPQGVCLKRMAGHQVGVRFMRVSADGALVLTGSGDRQVRGVLRGGSGGRRALADRRRRGMRRTGARSVARRARACFNTNK